MSCRRTADWYARCLDDPAVAHAEWRERGVAVLPLGARFEAVRIPDALARAATLSDRDDVVGLVLAVALEGPVIHDARGRNHYALVEPGTARGWGARAGAECLGHGTYLGVPDPLRARGEERRPLYWAAPPVPGDWFCRTAAVRLLVRVGEARLGEARPGGSGG
ncbi:hypothetical protein [Streptomyces sp. NPDC048606]|uniref:hypothetical protein n=1 Tax=Streptomyces sp. NPDC048606 TaxID=3154726 RepID=UPI00342AB4C1